MKNLNAGTKKMSGPSCSNFIKLIKVQCTGSWVSAWRRRCWRAGRTAAHHLPPPPHHGGLTLPPPLQPQPRSWCSCGCACSGLRGACRGLFAISPLPPPPSPPLQCHLRRRGPARGGRRRVSRGAAPAHRASHGHRGQGQDPLLPGRAGPDIEKG